MLFRFLHSFLRNKYLLHTLYRELSVITDTPNNIDIFIDISFYNIDIDINISFDNIEYVYRYFNIGRRLSSTKRILRKR